MKQLTTGNHSNNSQQPLIEITGTATSIHQIKEITDITTMEIPTESHITIENTAIDNLITATETKCIKRVNTQKHKAPN